MPFVRYGLAAERVGQLKLVAVNFAIPLEEVLSVYVSNEMNYAKLMEVVSQRMLEGATDSTAATQPSGGESPPPAGKRPLHTTNATIFEWMFAEGWCFCPAVVSSVKSRIASAQQNLIPLSRRNTDFRPALR